LFLGSVPQEDIALDCRFMKPQPRVITVVLNYNNLGDTLETLTSACQLTYENNSLLLVENSTTKGIVKKIRSQFPDLEIIENQRNLGYAGGNNVGMRYAINRALSIFFF